MIQDMRLGKGWSQQQLADISGLNVRTIQRIERGDQASLETYKALGAAFDVDFLTIKEARVRDITSSPENVELFLAYRKAQQVRGFYGHLLTYVLVNAGLAAINLLTFPKMLWFVFPLIGWGLGLAAHAAKAFDLLPWSGVAWERRFIEQHLGRKL